MSNIGDMKKLLRSYRSRGWQMEQSGGTHMKMWHPAIPASLIRVWLAPGDYRAVKNFRAKVARLERTRSTTISGQTAPLHRHERLL